jgi:FixJ family two-component response regulator
MSGMELQNRLLKSGIAIPIIIMTAHGDVPMVRNAMKAGAVEFLTKPFQDEDLLQAIDEAFAVDRALRTARTLEQSILLRLEALSPRERQVMDMVTAGMTNKEIAAVLNLQLVTVKLYRGQVMEKMQAYSFADLVKMSEKIKALEG